MDILLTGIISAIAFSPTHSGTLATGSYSQTTAVYSEDNMELLYILHGQLGGVTHVSFSAHELNSSFSINQWGNHLSPSRCNSLKMGTTYILEGGR